MTDKEFVMRVRFPGVAAGFVAVLIIAMLAGTCASGAVVTIQNGTIQTIGGETSCDIILDSASGGLLGYRMNLTLEPEGIAGFDRVRFPEWAGFLNSSLLVSPTDLYVKAADLGQVNPGATNVFLGEVTIKGIADGTAILAIDNLDIQDENGNWIDCTIQPGTITVGSGSGGTVPTTPPTTIPTTEVTTTPVTTPPTQVTTAPTTVPTTTPTTPSYLPEGNIYITSSPSKASLSLDGQPKGETPVLLSAPAGQHTLTVTADGYYPYSGTITFNAGALGVRSVKLQTTSGGQPPTTPPTSSPTTSGTTLPTSQPTIVPTTSGGFSWPVFHWPKITLPDFRPPWPFNYI